MDEKVSFRERLGIRMHLMMCKWCRRFSQQLSLIKEVTHNKITQIESGDTDSTVGLAPEARERINSALNNKPQ
jgi:hypothetical protein